MSKICLAVSEHDIDSAVKQIMNYQDNIDLAEIRADYLERDELEGIDRLPAKTQVPLIFTLRRKSDGGRYQGDEEERAVILGRAAASGYEYLDLESDVRFDSVESKCKKTGCRIIRSLHDFAGVPENLSDLIEALSSARGEIPKLAIMPQSISDLMQIISAADSHRGKEKIIIGMGPWGFLTRILAKRLGSYLTFTSPVDREAAPGHIDPLTLCDTYRFREISGSAEVFCVIGNPIMHSRSPWIHNPALRSLDSDSVYVPIQVDDVPLFFRSAETLGVKGISVTVPHKQAVRACLDLESEAVGAVGSCNTVYRKDNEWHGTNTDVGGFLVSLADMIGNLNLSGARISVIGAGGTSRAIVYALSQRGADVCIFNRTKEKARDLSAEFSCEWAPLIPSAKDLIGKYSDVIIQTTSAGMHPNTNLDPIEFYNFSGSEMVYDVIYAPPETPMLARARAAGCSTRNGEQMLLEQAYLQFELFTGEAYPEACRSIDVFSPD